MRAVLVLLPTLLLAGCGEVPWAGLRPDRRSPEPAGIETALPDGPALRLTLRGATSVAALVQEVGERRLWRTAGNRVVETDGGRVVATAGFGEMLAATRFDGPDPLAEAAALLDGPATARRLVDLMRADRAAEGMRFGIPVECWLTAQRTGEAAVLLVEERCRAEGSDQFTNRFWVATEGSAVLRAEQWIGPGLPMLTVDFRAAEAAEKPEA